MATLKKYDVKGKELEEVVIEDQLLDIQANHQMIKDYLVAIQYNARQWTASTKVRSEVIATGKKPYAQKGTGQARQGCIAAPHYRGGGRVFCPRPKFDMYYKMNKKEKRLAIAHLVAEKIKAGQSKVLSIKPEAIKGKTKEFATFLKKIGSSDKRVYIVAESNKEKLGSYDSLLRSIHNIPNVEFVLAPNLNGFDLVRCQEVIFIEPAIEEIKTLLASGRE
jgi:large subunit ribosomal protein L4